MKSNIYGVGRQARILVADDHPLVREGLVHLIKRQDDMVCCGEADGLAGAFEAVAAGRPDLVTVDIQARGGRGLELIHELRQQNPSVQTLVISQCDEMVYAEKALKAGASGYVMKERSTDEVVAAIRTVLAGELYVSPKVAVLALRKLGRTGSKKNKDMASQLTPRETEVLELLGAGLSTRQVAVRLGLSIKTIDTYRENLKTKLGLAGAAQLVHYAMNWVSGQGSRYSPVVAPLLNGADRTIGVFSSERDA